MQKLLVAFGLIDNLNELDAKNLSFTCTFWKDVIRKCFNWYDQNENNIPFNARKIILHNPITFSKFITHIYVADDFQNTIDINVPCNLNYIRFPSLYMANAVCPISTQKMVVGIDFTISQESESPDMIKRILVQPRSPTLGHMNSSHFRMMCCKTYGNIRASYVQWSKEPTLPNHFIKYEQCTSIYLAPQNSFGIRGSKKLYPGMKDCKYFCQFYCDHKYCYGISNNGICDICNRCSKNVYILFQI